MLAPPDPRTPFEGWAVSHEGLVIVIALSEGILRARKVVICAAMEPNLDQDTLVKIIEASTQSRAAHEEVHNLQRHRGWFGAKNGEPIAIQLTTGATDSISSAILSVVARAPE
ncbi:MAG: hypothetical protein PSV46_27180 [Reyranella sp.]|nr:hypothetical protein [Reyranella sp.]